MKDKGCYGIAGQDLFTEGAFVQSWAVVLGAPHIAHSDGRPWIIRMKWTCDELCRCVWAACNYFLLLNSQSARCSRGGNATLVFPLTDFCVGHFD